MGLLEGLLRFSRRVIRLGTNANTARGLRQITMYTTEEHQFDGQFGERELSPDYPTRAIRIWEFLGRNPVVRGEFPMPFQATVTVIGNKPGCLLP
jgi:hypothetical protein